MIEQICQGSKVKSALRHPEDWILRYIRAYLFHVSACGCTGSPESDKQQSSVASDDALWSTYSRNNLRRSLTRVLEVMTN